MGEAWHSVPAAGWEPVGRPHGQRESHETGDDSQESRGSLEEWRERGRPESHGWRGGAAQHPTWGSLGAPSGRQRPAQCRAWHRLGRRAMRGLGLRAEGREGLWPSCCPCGSHVSFMAGGRKQRPRPIWESPSVQSAPLPKASNQSSQESLLSRLKRMDSRPNCHRIHLTFNVALLWPR